MRRITLLISCFRLSRKKIKNNDNFYRQKYSISFNESFIRGCAVFHFPLIIKPCAANTLHRVLHLLYASFCMLEYTLGVILFILAGFQSVLTHICVEDPLVTSSPNGSFTS